MQNSYDVSRETEGKIDSYVNHLIDWTGRINLIGSNDLSILRTRHIEDCRGLARLLPMNADRCIDLGSGGGLPGVIIAVVRPDIDLILVESDGRKGAFLRMICRELQLNAKVITGRIERIDPLQADIIVARALAPLTRLLDYMHRHGGRASRGYFMKGRSWRDEIDDAEREWTVEYQIHITSLEYDSAVLEIGNLRKKTNG